MTNLHVFLSVKQVVDNCDEIVGIPDSAELETLHNELQTVHGRHSHYECKRSELDVLIEAVLITARIFNEPTTEQIQEGIQDLWLLA